MRILLFVHSLRSCWNNGHAHFLRGVARELGLLGHRVIACEKRENWSSANLTAEAGDVAASGLEAFYPDLEVTTYDEIADLDVELDRADLVVVHEWNPPEFVAAIGARRARSRFSLLFHDSHHRCVSDPEAMSRYDLEHYDGVLAFGETVAEVYRRSGWGRRAFVWHEAADHRLFVPPPTPPGPDAPLVWIGNWGEGERANEIEAYLLRPAAAWAAPLNVFGVRYPPDALRMLACYGASYHGWLPNVAAPRAFANSLATFHVPRRFYAANLAGVPTIRVFEALSAGIPLLSAPWRDSEGLFTVGEDFLMARDPADMGALLGLVLKDVDLRQALAARGRATILSRHTCAHRAQELLAIHRKVSADGEPAIATYSPNL